MTYTQKCIEIERHLLKLSQYFTAKIRTERIQAYTEDLAAYPLDAILQTCARMKSESSKPWPSISDFKSVAASFIDKEELPDCVICNNLGVRLFFEREEIEKFGKNVVGQVAFACTCMRGRVDYPSILSVTKMESWKYISVEEARSGVIPHLLQKEKNKLVEEMIRMTEIP